MCKKAMISQPMDGKTSEEIQKNKENAIKYLTLQDYEIVETYFTDKWYSKESMQSRGVIYTSLCFLGKSLESMSQCHAVYFCSGWEQARGCLIEHAAAVAYGLKIYEEDKI